MKTQYDAYYRSIPSVDRKKPALRSVGAPARAAQWAPTSVTGRPSVLEAAHPDIVEAILEGRQPLTLKFEHLYKYIPLSWTEQRRQFGFPQDLRPAKSVPQ